MTEGDPGRGGERGQVESIGSVLFVGVVVLSVSTFGVFYLTTGFEGADGGAGSVNVVGDASGDAIALTHGGGPSLSLSDLRVVVANGSARTEYDLTASAVDGDGDDAFDPGESWRRDWSRAGEEVTVRLVDDAGGRVLYEETFAFADETPTGTPEPPGTPTPEPDGTATPADPNDPPAPAARGGTVEGRAGETLTLDGSDTTDPDGDSLTYEWRVVDRDGLPENATRVADDTVTSPNATFEVRENVTDRNHTLTIELVADDGEETASDAATVEVEKLNRPPVAEAGEDVVMGRDGDGHGDGHRRSVERSPGRPAELSVGSRGHARAAVSEAPATGRRAFGDGWWGGWWGDDGDGDDGDPVAAVTLDGSESYDPDGDDLTYEWEVVDGDGIGDELGLSDRSSVRPTLGVDSVVTDRDRSVTVRLAVTDDDGLTDTDTVNVSVAARGGDDRHGGGWWDWWRWWDDDHDWWGWWNDDGHWWNDGGHRDDGHRDDGHWWDRWW